MLELVVHCWSGDAVPVYHLMLQLQASSLLLHTPNVPTKLTVFYSPCDIRTASVLGYFHKLLNNTQNLSCSAIALDESRLFRRAIGRDIAARNTKADVVWFTDVDYLFGQSAIDEAYKLCLASDCPMVWPQIVQIHKEHAIGDALTHRLTTADMCIADRGQDTDYYPRTERRAIGGEQVTLGAWCRDHGYPAKQCFLEPVDEKEGFRQCRGDVSFRKQFGDNIEAVDIPNIYRVRHSRAGRDGGTKDHGK